MPGTDVSGAYTLMDRVRMEVADTGSAAGMTFSVGVTGWDGEESPSHVIERADEALYAAKEQGRNMVVAFAADVSG